MLIPCLFRERCASQPLHPNPHEAAQKEGNIMPGIMKPKKMNVPPPIAPCTTRGEWEKLIQSDLAQYRKYLQKSESKKRGNNLGTFDLKLNGGENSLLDFIGGRSYVHTLGSDQPPSSCNTCNNSHKRNSSVAAPLCAVIRIYGIRKP